jgi:hypothetical protein
MPYKSVATVRQHHVATVLRNLQDPKRRLEYSVALPTQTKTQGHYRCKSKDSNLEGYRPTVEPELVKWSFVGRIVWLQEGSVRWNGLVESKIVLSKTNSRVDIIEMIQAQEKKKRSECPSVHQKRWEARGGARHRHGPLRPQK